LAGRLPHGQPLPPKRDPLSKDANAKTHMTAKLRSNKGSKIYAQPKAIAFPVGGIEKFNAEWHQIANTRNLLNFYRFHRSWQQALVVATE